MPTEEATRLKNEGTAAYSRNDFLTAVSQFTAAIDKSSATTKEDKDFLKLLHSNRSAAYQNLKQYEKALEDGNRCVAIDAQWPKGYGRKGDALLALKKFGEAYNAYNAGLRITPADQSLAEKAERAMSGIRSETQRAYSGATNDSAASSDSKWTKYLRMAVLGSFFAYCIPFGGMSTLFGRVCAGSFAAEQVLGVLARHGMPRFENDYAVRVLPDPAMPALLLGVFVALSPRVYFMSLLAVLLLSLPLFLPAILQYGRSHSRYIEEKALPLVRQYAPSAAPFLQYLPALLSDRQIPQLTLVLKKLAAQAQVSQGIFLVVELLLPTRNILQLYLWWQFLKMQYMQEHGFGAASARPKLIQEAFKEIDGQLTGLLSHRLVPQMVRTAYATLKSYLAKQVERPVATAANGTDNSRAGLGGLLSRCTVM